MKLTTIALMELQIGVVSVNMANIIRKKFNVRQRM